MPGRAGEVQGCAFTWPGMGGGAMTIGSPRILWEPREAKQEAAQSNAGGKGRRGGSGTRSNGTKKNKRKKNAKKMKRVLPPVVDGSLSRKSTSLCTKSHPTGKWLSLGELLFYECGRRPVVSTEAKQKEHLFFSSGALSMKFRRGICHITP